MPTDKVNDKWKKDFKDKLGDYKHPVRNGMWDDISNSLPRQKKRSGRQHLWAWIGSTAAMLTTIIVLAGPHISTYIKDLEIFDTKTEKTDTKSTKQKGKGYGKKIQEVYEVETESEDENEEEFIDGTANNEDEYIDTDNNENENIDTENINDKKETEKTEGTKKTRKIERIKKPIEQKQRYNQKPRKDVKTNYTKKKKEEKKRKDDDLPSSEEPANDSITVVMDTLNGDTLNIHILPVDTLALAKDIKTEETEEEAEDDTVLPKIKRDYSSWSFAISSKNMIYNGYNKQWGETDMNLPTDVKQTIGEIKQFSHPININLTVRKQFNKHWAMEGGISYTYLWSKETLINNLSSATIVNNIKIHNVGIPINVEYILYHSHKINIYSKYGIMVEKTKESKNRIKDWQVSTWLSGGMSYRLGKNIGLFIEPGATYYFDNHTALPTLRNEAPLNFDITAGLRFYPFTH